MGNTLTQMLYWRKMRILKNWQKESAYRPNDSDRFSSGLCSPSGLDMKKNCNKTF